ncbi:uncharacterized protein LOC110976651 [Acanthaster planci]|uniref:Uncharacterized protein LOC110976651 n=1 Tax=Acanthaster planci TaxID=133434 RepID=A0A8B7Y1H1_ACAPL|nr:uncharacterized protein LOC110976651 [Acanthaster planci]
MVIFREMLAHFLAALCLAERCFCFPYDWSISVADISSAMTSLPANSTQVQPMISSAENILPSSVRADVGSTSPLTRHYRQSSSDNKYLINSKHSVKLALNQMSVEAVAIGTADGTVVSSMEVIPADRPDLVRIRFGDYLYLALSSNGRKPSSFYSPTPLTRFDSHNRTIWCQITGRSGERYSPYVDGTASSCSWQRFLAVKPSNQTNSGYKVRFSNSTSENTLFLEISGDNIS